MGGFLLCVDNDLECTLFINLIQIHMVSYTHIKITKFKDCCTLRDHKVHSLFSHKKLNKSPKWILSNASFFHSILFFKSSACFNFYENVESTDTKRHTDFNA